MEEEITYPYINSYLSKILKYSDPLLNEMEEYAAKNHIPIVQPESARILSVICNISKPKRILEVGTAIGYSSIILSNSMHKNGIIDTIELDEDMAERAREYIVRAGLDRKIRILQGDAAEVLQCLSTPYDFIFLDAAKGQYIEFLPFCLRLLNPGGVFVTDNVLYKGMVAKDGIVKHKHRTIIVNLREYLQSLCQNPDLNTSIVPVGDGIAICVKNEDKKENFT